MKLKTTVYQSHKVEIEREITKVVHNIPTWIFSETMHGQIKNPCPVCNREMRKEISHGICTEECSVIELNGYVPIPIHTECYNKLKAANENATK